MSNYPNCPRCGRTEEDGMVCDICKNEERLKIIEVELKQQRKLIKDLTKAIQAIKRGDWTAW